MDEKQFKERTKGLAVRVIRMTVASIKTLREKQNPESKIPNPK